MRNQREEAARSALRHHLLGVQGRREYWNFVRSVRGAKNFVETDGPVTERHFRSLLGVDFDAALDATDYSYNPEDVVECLDSPIEPWEVKKALHKMRNSACGEDRISASALKKLECDDIASFFAKLNSIDDLPVSWARSVLVPIPKAGKDCSKPGNLRGLSVQTCIRRLYSRCLLPRLMSWVNSSNSLPEAQTGFCKGYRTTDNLAIMRALHERCAHNRVDLFVAFVDVEKAFDNVSRARLWGMLHSKGAKGQLIVQLRKLYRDTSTVLRLRGRYSEPFDVSRGVLQGDPLSPILFIFYIADLDTSHPDDPVLDDGNFSVAETLIADDTAFPSTTALGLQYKLDTCYKFYKKIGLNINADKSKIMRLVSITRRPYVFYIEDRPLEEVLSFKYIGYTLEGWSPSRGLRWRSKAYVEKVVKRTRSVATSLLQLRRFLGPTNADFMMRFYCNLVDCYFVFAAEVSFNTTQALEREMDQILVGYAKASLGLAPNAIRLLCLFDNAVFEVHHRRLQLAARFFEYAHLCGAGRAVFHALEDSMRLPDGWYAAFAARCQRLDVDPKPRRGLAVAVSLAIKRQINDAWKALILGSRMGVHQLSVPILEFPAKKLRYTRILSLKGCRALARLRASAHMLNVERMRHVADRVPREDRRCPDCPDFVESEFHAFFQCSSHAEAGRVFFRELFLLKPDLERLDQRSLLGRLLNPGKDFAAITCAYVAAVFAVVDARYLVRVA